LKVIRALKLVLTELLGASKKHRGFSSPHEGAYIIEEEFDELKDEIRKLKSFSDRRTTEHVKEAIQVAAMALRYVIEFGEDEI